LQTFRHCLLHDGYIEMFQGRLSAAGAKLAAPFGSLEGFFQDRGDLIGGIVRTNDQGAPAMFDVSSVIADICGQHGATGGKILG